MGNQQDSHKVLTLLKARVQDMAFLFSSSLWEEKGKIKRPLRRVLSYDLTGVTGSLSSVSITTHPETAKLVARFCVQHPLRAKKGLITLPHPVAHQPRQRTRLWPSPTLSFPGFDSTVGRGESRPGRKLPSLWGGAGRGGDKCRAWPPVIPKRFLRGALGPTAQFRALR